MIKNFVTQTFAQTIFSNLIKNVIYHIFKGMVKIFLRYKTLVNSVCKGFWSRMFFQKTHFLKRNFVEEKYFGTFFICFFFPKFVENFEEIFLINNFEFIFWITHQNLCYSKNSIFTKNLLKIFNKFLFFPLNVLDVEYFRNK